MRPLLADLTAIMIWSGISLSLLMITARYIWRRRKGVEEP